MVARGTPRRLMERSADPVHRCGHCRTGWTHRYTHQHSHDAGTVIDGRVVAGPVRQPAGPNCWPTAEAARTDYRWRCNCKDGWDALDAAKGRQRQHSPGCDCAACNEGRGSDGRIISLCLGGPRSC